MLVIIEEAIALQRVLIIRGNYGFRWRGLNNLVTTVNKVVVDNKVALGIAIAVGVNLVKHIHVQV